MKFLNKIIIFTALLLLASCSTQKKVVKENKLNTGLKKIAITIDDLPFAINNKFISLDEQKKLFTELMNTLRKYNIKATGFLIGNKYSDEWKDLIKQFIMEGHTLANHTYSHEDLNAVSAEEYLNNIQKCDALLETLVSETKQTMDRSIISHEIQVGNSENQRVVSIPYPNITLHNKSEIYSIIKANESEIQKIMYTQKNYNWKYFRYPYLNRGDTQYKKSVVLNSLYSDGYQIAPVTITSNDWRFNSRFELAYMNGNISDMENIGGKYLSRINRETTNSETYASQNFHRNVNHILLFHSNAINSINLEKIIEFYLANGWEFVTLDEALEDPIYEMSDGYNGSYGVPWLFRAKKQRRVVSR